MHNMISNNSKISERLPPGSESLGQSKKFYEGSLTETIQL